MAPPTATVGVGLTTMLMEAVASAHKLPPLVNVNVTGVPEAAPALYVAVLGVAPVLRAKVPPASASFRAGE